MLVLKIKGKSFIYSCHKNIYQPLFISTLWLSGSAGVEAELHPDYRNHSRRSPQFTTYCNLHFLLLSSPYCKGSRGIQKKLRRNITGMYNIQLCCCRATGVGAVPLTTEVFISLCAKTSLGRWKTASECTKIQPPGLVQPEKCNSPQRTRDPCPWFTAELNPKHPVTEGERRAHRVPLRWSQGRSAEATTRLQSTARSSVCSVLPLLVFFIFLFVGTLGAEPLDLFWGCSRDPDARPVEDREMWCHRRGVTLLLFLTPRN